MYMLSCQLRRSETQKMHKLWSQTTDITNTYQYKHTHMHTHIYKYTYTTNFPHTHFVYSFTDSECGTFEKGEWV